jgi:hypothetical protein
MGFRQTVGGCGIIQRLALGQQILEKPAGLGACQLGWLVPGLGERQPGAQGIPALEDQPGWVIGKSEMMGVQVLTEPSHPSLPQPDLEFH